MVKPAEEGSLVIVGETPLSTRTPRIRPLRSVMAMIASLLAEAAAASKKWASLQRH
ncbi:MAG: hypothetical protein U0792_15200 [Gemmataceae bacterium]